MTDTPETTPAGTPPVQETPPVPQEIPKMEPAKAESPPETSASISPDRRIQFRDKDGNLVTPTVGELVDTFKGRPSEEETAEMGLLQRAFKENDPEAIRELVMKTLPEKTQETAPVAEGEEVTELRKQVESLTQLVQKSIAPVVGQITQEADLVRTKSVIDSMAKEYPYAAKLPQAAPLVLAKKAQYEKVVRDKGYDPMTMAMAAQIQKKAIEDVNAFFAEMDKTLRGEGGQKPPATGPVSVNDQEVPPEGVRPGAWVLKDGFLVDPSRVPTTEAAGQPLPAQPVTPAPGGTPVGVENPQQPGPMTEESMKQRMRQRVQVFGP